MIYRVESETDVLITDGEVTMMSPPTDNPSESLTRLKHIKNNVFKRLRDDRNLAETVVFETGPDGKVTRLVPNSNNALRVR